MSSVLRLVALLVTLVASSASARGESLVDPAVRDRTAVEAYRRGDLDSARSAWTELLESGAVAGAERARVLHNLGNNAFRERKLLEAVGWYASSLRLRPRDADTWANLEHARSLAKLEPADRGDLDATVQRALASLTLAESAWLVLAAALVWLALSLGEALRGGRVWRRLAFGGLALVVLSLPPWIYNLARANSDPLLVVATGDVDVRSEPRTQAAAIAKTEAGAELERLDELPEWTKVELADGTQGWVASRAVFALVR